MSRGGATEQPVGPESSAVVAIAFNPVAGAGRAAGRAERLGTELRRLALEPVLLPSEHPGEIARAAGEWCGRCRAFAVVGGDGTAREAAEGLAGCETPLAFLPAGTANVLATELGLPFDPTDLARLIHAGATREIDVFEASPCAAGTCRGLLFASAGFDGEVVRRVAEMRSARREAGLGATLAGMHAYTGPILAAWVGWQPVPLDLAVDGAPVPGGPFAWVIVANARNYGGLFRLGPEIDPSDGVLDVIALRAGGRADLALAALAGLATGVTDAPGVVAFQAHREVRLSRPEGVPIQVDGDPAGRTPLLVRLATERLRVVAGGAGGR